MTLDELERLARAATPGPWTMHNRENIRECGPDSYSKDDWHGYAWVGIKRDPFDGMLADLDRRQDGCAEFREAADKDAAYIAACFPERILALVACVRAADRLLDPGGTKAAVSAYKAARADLENAS